MGPFIWVLKGCFYDILSHTRVFFFCLEAFFEYVLTMRGALLMSDKAPTLLLKKYWGPMPPSYYGPKICCITCEIDDSTKQTCGTDNCTTNLLKASYICDDFSLLEMLERDEVANHLEIFGLLRVIKYSLKFTETTVKDSSPQEREMKGILERKYSTRQELQGK